jgi:hypothetical protein
MVSKRHHLAALIAVMLGADVATAPHDAADHSMRQFLAQSDVLPSYRATRRLDARTGSRRGWLDVATAYDPATGLTYEITAEGGSGFIRNRVLRGVLEAERRAIAEGETARASLEPANYSFVPNGVDTDGLAKVLISPRRKERILVVGTLFLTPAGGELVRLEGRLAKNPSFWVRNVEIVRRYERIGGAIVPVSLDSEADLRLFGHATFQMTYAYSEIGGRSLTF